VARGVKMKRTHAAISILLFITCYTITALAVPLSEHEDYPVAEAKTHSFWDGYFRVFGQQEYDGLEISDYHGSDFENSTGHLRSNIPYNLLYIDNGEDLLRSIIMKYGIIPHHFLLNRQTDRSPGTALITEPTTILLLGVGLFGIANIGRRRV
jgi:hypothetical protein